MNPDPSKCHLARVASIVVVLVALAWASGCARYREDRKQDALEVATNAYAAALRWGYYETAIGYLHPGKRKVAEVPKSLGNIRVTGYDVVQPPVPVGDYERIQVVRIDYVHEDVQAVRSLTDRQTWRYDAPTKAWWLDSGLPAFK